MKKEENQIRPLAALVLILHFGQTRMLRTRMALASLTKTAW